MRLSPLALGALFCAGAGVTAQAQQIEAPTLGSERQFHGSASLRAMYDTNFARSSKAAAALRGIEQKEYTLTPR